MTALLTDMVFPGDANHHGTLFGGVALARMDKAAFIAATRHARLTFVTAACERIDFVNAARVGEVVEAFATVVRAGRKSLTVEVTLEAESLLSGDRRVCARGHFHMVATDAPDGYSMPPVKDAA